MSKQELYKQRTKAKDLLDWRVSQNTVKNVVKFGLNEGLQHALKKTEICYGLKQRGKEFYTEAIFKGEKGRADIFVLDDCLAFEIVDTEADSNIKEKIARYPCEIYYLSVLQNAKDFLQMVYGKI